MNDDLNNVEKEKPLAEDSIENTAKDTAQDGQSDDDKVQDEVEVATDSIEDASEETPPAQEVVDVPEVVEIKEVVETPEVVATEENITKEQQQELSEETKESNDDEEDNDNTVDYDTLTKPELVEAIESIIDQDIVIIKTRVSLIKLAFISIVKDEKDKQLSLFVEKGGDPKDFKQELDELDERFNAAFKTYKENKKKFENEQEAEKQNNLEKKNQILEEIKKLIESEDELKNTYDAFKKLQYEWKEVGQVPRKETNNLWQNYHFLVEKFLDKVRINEELRDLDRKKNLEHCIELCEKAEELLINPKINESFKLLQRYHQEWKEVGPLPSDKKEEVWERFKQASDKVIERRREFFDKIRMDQENNYAAKVVLCEKMEELVKNEIKNNNAWNEVTNKVGEIQDLWKTLGPAPKKQNDEVWVRFRAAINLFYENKKEFFDKIKDEYVNNYNLKLDICAQAEALKDSNDWKRTTMALIRLQNDWKKIGPVPRKHSDEIWKRFRAACNYFFEKKSEFYANIEGKENENLQAKLQIVNKIKEAKIEGDKRQILDALKTFQRDFTAIGHVPIKEKERIQNLLREAINEKLDELKINPVEKKIIGFTSKFEAIKSDPASKDIIRKEVQFINGKLTQLRSDMQLWENNIGFFANSKSADILKQEFEIKIQKAKEEIEVLEQKLKFLRER